METGNEYPDLSVDFGIIGVEFHLNYVAIADGNHRPGEVVSFMMDYSQAHQPRMQNKQDNRGLPNEPLTIAYFSSSPGGGFSFEKWLMWRGIAEAAREQGINLLYVAGEEFEHHPQAVLYDLIGTHNVNGLITWNSFVSQHSSLELAQEFVDRYHPLPIVSVELELERCSSLMVDNARGVRDLLAHLIDHHGHQRIAFIAQENNHTSRVRQEAFVTAMDSYGILDPLLIGSIEELDARGVAWGTECRAVMTPADDIAIRFVEMLRGRGLRVPEDVSVTGFNDGQEARGAFPPLTTARLPFRSLGRKAVELLLNQIHGQPPTSTLFLAPQLTLRRSCGCLEPMAEQAAAGSYSFTHGDPHAIMASIRASMLPALMYRMGTSIESQASLWVEKTLDIFFKELERSLANPEVREPSEEYMSALSDLLREAVAEGSNVTRWHEALSLLREKLLPYLQGNTLQFAEDLWQQARVLIGQVAVRAEIHRTWHAEQRSEILRSIEADLLIALDFDELINILVQGISRLGVQNFYLVLYEDGSNPQDLARLVLAIENGQRMTAYEGQLFQAIHILPDACLSKRNPYGLVIEALHMREEQMGYIVFRAGPPADVAECVIYPALRVQLSSALKSVRLRQKLQDARQQAEDANQLKSRFLSMVSHELRTPINLIVGLSEMAMRQQSRGKDSLEVQRKFLEQIYVSGQHLDRLIRDVLDLASSQAGQMSLMSKQLDLVPVLRDVASIGQQLAGQKNLAFHAVIPEILPRVWGDKTRLRQILLNLLSNAVKFTAHGAVVLRVEASPAEVTISVEDTGLGIAKEEQELLFNEFHQTDRTTARGYGGIGLGLAITRRLVEMHGGRIWVTSDGVEGSGSQFHFTIPALPSDTEQEEESFSGLEGVVMVLTGTIGEGQKLVQRLSHHGFTVEEMGIDQHPDFMEKIIASPPGAIVLDFTPASEVGWEIMKVLKETNCTQDIPVLFYSLMAEEDIGSVYEMDYLTKPIGTEQLVQALKRHGLKTTGVSMENVILIIDDDPGILDLHARMVKSELPNCRVLTAQSGYQGLEVMRNISPDLVLLDLMMPELDGFGVLKNMQEDHRLRGIPVIILSAQVLTKEDMAKLNQGVAAVLGKGLFTTKETIERIESALARNKRLGSETQRLVHHGMAYIHEHYREQLSRADIARHLAVNEQYLSRTFNKELGIGPMAYLSRYRIQQAKRLLETGAMSITQIALEVGFTSQSYFSRIFQQETGVSPSVFQRKNHS